MKIKEIFPRGEFCLGRLIKEPNGSVILPDAVTVGTYEIAEVLRVGQGVKTDSGWIDSGIKESVKVLVFKERYDKVKTEAGELILFRMDDVSAIIN